MKSPGKRHRLYVDESGDHVFRDRNTLAEERHRYLCVAACWFVQRPDYVNFRDSLAALKTSQFPDHPNSLDRTPILLHREDMVQRRGAFWRLRDSAFRSQWDAALLQVLREAKFQLFGTVVDKFRLKAAHPADPFDPYEVALAFLLQRYCGYLGRFNGVGDIVAESRGRGTDRRLQQAFGRILKHGDAFHQRPAGFYADVLSVKDMVFRRKHENVAGLQLADILAHPLKRYVLLEKGHTSLEATAFETQIFDVLRDKFNRRVSDGRVPGYGWVLYP